MANLFDSRLNGGRAGSGHQHLSGAKANRTMEIKIRSRGAIAVNVHLSAMNNIPLDVQRMTCTGGIHEGVWGVVDGVVVVFCVD